MQLALKSKIRRPLKTPPMFRLKDEDGTDVLSCRKVVGALARANHWKEGENRRKYLTEDGRVATASINNEIKCDIIDIISRLGCTPHPLLDISCAICYLKKWDKGCMITFHEHLIQSQIGNYVPLEKKRCI